MAAGDYGGNRQHYRIQWLERPGSGAWTEACSEQGLAEMICWCPGGALLAQLPGTTLRAMFWPREGRGVYAHRSPLDRS
jgi:hypothetical protein